MTVLKNGTEELIRYYRNNRQRSYSYILPLLSLHREDILIDKFGQYTSDKEYCMLLNCFIKDENHPNLNNHIFLLYKFYGSREFVQFEKQLQDHPYYLNMYDPYSNMVMFIFEVPPVVENDYKLLIKGKYSKISPSTKDKIVDFHGVREQGASSKLIQVLYKMEAAFKANEDEINKGLPTSQWITIPREQEASSMMDIDKETFKLIPIQDRIAENSNPENITGFNEEESKKG